MMSKFQVVFVLFVAVFSISTKATILPGRCPVVPVKDGFSISQYLGVWYDIRSYFAFFQIGVNCSRAEYTQMPNSSFVRVNNTGTVFAFNGSRVMVNATGKAWAPNRAIPAKLVVQFDNMSNATGDYWVAETDYTTFSIVWACSNIAAGLFHEAHSWVLGRSPSGFNANTEAIIDKALATHNIDPTLFRPTVQKNCVNY
ncbi:apolipoprotein D-like [Paramacrobiotus metropolitanus]|uniref:apolipoprotein D-like n=1 Tax=Paramacrobiotus metropolitanus TaxID=2943436 RepID=UPI002446001B|nr:apolipoprotein D-like [Paramacrobiotus metropolitanus]